MSYFRSQLEEWLRGIDVKTDKVLDIGGGSNPVKGRTKSWEVNEYEILDNELEEREDKSWKPILFDLNKDKIWENDSWLTADIIFCLEVMEYVYDPINALRNLLCMLKKGGILYISFPFIYPHHEPEGYDYLRYTKWGAQKLLEESGFDIKEIKSRYVEESSLGHIWRSEGMHPTEGHKNHNEIGYLVEAVKK